MKMNGSTFACLLWYSPCPGEGHHRKVRRKPLAVLFLALAVGFAAIAIFAATAGGGAWVIAVAAAALAVWMGGLAYRAFR